MAQGDYSDPVLTDLHPALDAVRASAEFQPKPESWIDQMMRNPEIRDAVRGFERSIDRFFEQLREAIRGAIPPQAGDVSEVVITVMSYAFSVVLIFLLVVAIYLILTWLKQRIEEQRRGMFVEEEEARVTDELVDAAWHEKEALRLAEAGDYRHAMRQMYLATLCLLAEKRIVPFEASRTDAEYLRELSRMPVTALPAAFGEMAARFERVRYGNFETDAEGFAEYGKRFADLESNAASVVRPKP